MSQDLQLLEFILAGGNQFTQTRFGRVYGSAADASPLESIHIFIKLMTGVCQTLAGSNKTQLALHFSIPFLLLHNGSSRLSLDFAGANTVQYRAVKHF